jgi:hypothetical protein
MSQELISSVNDVNQETRDRGAIPPLFQTMPAKALAGPETPSFGVPALLRTLAVRVQKWRGGHSLTVSDRGQHSPCPPAQKGVYPGRGVR